jgi:hypothetical protein
MGLILDLIYAKLEGCGLPVLAKVAFGTDAPPEPTVQNSFFNLSVKNFEYKTRPGLPKSLLSKSINWSGLSHE